MKRHSESSMRSLYREWQSSGLGKKSFAIEQSVSPSTFYYWIKKFEKSTKESTAKRGFYPIDLGDIVSEPVTATVRYPSGVVIEWRGKADTIHLLKTLL